MENNLSVTALEATFRLALSKGLIREEDTLLLFHDLEHLQQRAGLLKSAFPPQTLHAVAIKANPLIRILELMKPWGTGIEAATLGEVHLALEAGYPPEMIVYDSPVKTPSEIAFALSAGIHLNIDNFSELQRVEEYLRDHSSASTLGIRINPQVGTGTIAESSVAGEYSKFGIPIRNNRKELKEAFLANEKLTGVHLHVGSQGCAMEMLVKGIGILYEFAEEVNRAAGTGRIRTFDIGGGLPVSYRQGSQPPSMQDYAEAIRKEFPSLFSGKFRLITEFGRWMHVNAGWTVSRVEYVKHDPGVKTAMIHAGADLFVRECLNPSDWHHEYSVLDPKGNLKTGRDALLWNLAGPLCFAGDILARNVALPPVEEGDWLVIHDTGGYTFSMWSRYNSRQTPRILGYSGERFVILKEREGLEDIRRAWE
ncbi:MAG TPA: hypothetical protein VMC08_05570 [Bacteroidales bacterium]|nr:hypothetical protein [Bacteroidales bacterium]